MIIRRSLTLFALLIAAASLLSSCGKKNETADGAANDSLLSANPVEQPQGQVTPQNGVQQGGNMQPSTPAPHSTGTHSSPAHRPSSNPAPAPGPSAHVAAGTPLSITMETPLTSATASPGQSWTGSVAQSVTVGGLAPFPAGSIVHGVVEGAAPAEKGSRAFLVLRVTSIEANGRAHDISATADSLVAGSTRKRNIGAIAGSAAAGALLGKAVGGSNKGALIGGLLGGAAATGVVANTKGFQVEIAQGKELVFRVDHDTNVRM